MTKKIITIGVQLSSVNTHHEEFRSKVSLLDWDIVLFRPTTSEFLAGRSTFQGKPSLGDTASFQLKECCEHWRREIKQAVDTGKTVFVFLPVLEEVYIDTGKREFSGTGRNQKTTTIVELYSNYRALPVELAPVNASGSAIKLVSTGAEVLAPFWSEFSPRFAYKVLLSSNAQGVSLVTRNGDKPVGCLLRSKNSSGSLILLPDFDCYAPDFITTKNSERKWTQAATQFAAKFIGSLVELDRSLRSSAEITPEPSWAAAEQFVLSEERALRKELLEAEQRVEQAQREKEALFERATSAGRVRALLYEKGKPLELAIIEALRQLGFKAEPYKQGASEFDVVFVSEEGRLLGEAEGKDSKAINVDKLRQLAMNINEDLQREEVTEPAKGVLFGNGYRLTAPNERNVQFTEKCVIAAIASGTALIATTDLFAAVQHILAESDEDFAKRCRTAMLVGKGIVQMPAPPQVEGGAQESATASQLAPPAEPGTSAP